MAKRRYVVEHKRSDWKQWYDEHPVPDTKARAVAILLGVVANHGNWQGRIKRNGKVVASISPRRISWRRAVPRG